MDEARTLNKCVFMLLVFVLAIGMLLNVYLTLRLSTQIGSITLQLHARPSLPCAAIPTRFVMDEPVCAQKLIEAMNVTNVRVLANVSVLPGLGVRAPNRSR